MSTYPKRLEKAIREIGADNVTESARKLGIAKSAIYKYFLGHSEPASENLRAIATFGHDLHELITGAPFKVPESIYVESRIAELETGNGKLLMEVMTLKENANVQMVDEIKTEYLNAKQRIRELECLLLETDSDCTFAQIDRFMLSKSDAPGMKVNSGGKNGEGKL